MQEKILVLDIDGTLTKKRDYRSNQKRNLEYFAAWT